MIAAAMSSGSAASLTNLPAGPGRQLDEQLRLDGPRVRGLAVGKDVSGLCGSTSLSLKVSR